MLADPLFNSEELSVQLLRGVLLVCLSGDIISMVDERTAGAGSRRRQTVLLSATLHDKLDTLASLSLQDPAAIGFEVKVCGISALRQLCGM
jgi:hypothetical protein